MPFTFYFLASLFYLAITIVSMLGQQRIEAWANRGVRRT
jgi:ABC-type arginine transport system permease subunit